MVIDEAAKSLRSSPRPLAIPSQLAKVRVKSFVTALNPRIIRLIPLCGRVIFGKSLPGISPSVDAQTLLLAGWKGRADQATKVKGACSCARQVARLGFATDHPEIQTRAR